MLKAKFIKNETTGKPVAKKIYFDRLDTLINNFKLDSAYGESALLAIMIVYARTPLEDTLTDWWQTLNYETIPALAATKEAQRNIENLRDNIHAHLSYAFHLAKHIFEGNDETLGSMPDAKECNELIDLMLKAPL